MSSIAIPIVSYIVAVVSVLFLFVFALRVPFILTNDDPLVTEYYITNFATNVPLDILFITCYMLVAWGVAYVSGVSDATNQFIIVCLTTSVLTLIFWGIFNTMEGSSFFIRWFRRVGLRAVVYDVLMVGFVFLIYTWLRTTALAAHRQK